MPHKEIHSRTRNNAKRLRRNQSSAEEIIWEELRAKRFFGYGFRRQVPFGAYVADFACHEARLIVEIDGPSHHNPSAREHDQLRESYLVAEGYRIVRVRNDEVFESLEGVLHAIGQFLPRYESDLAPLETPLPVPPPQGGRERK